MISISPFLQTNKGLLLLAALAALLIVGVGAVIISSHDRPIKIEQNAEFELRGVGRIPNLTTVMKDNGKLRQKVRDFCALDESYVFGNIAETDKVIVEILLMWSGIDPEKDPKFRTREGLHSHVDHFIREAYAMKVDSIVVNNPLVGKNPWLDLFERYKARLISQCAAGQKVYDGPILYDAEYDMLHIRGELSGDFIRGFKAFVQTKEDPKRYINNFLVFVDESKGLKKLSADERKLIGDLRG